MKKRQILILFEVIIGIIILTNLPFLPGPQFLYVPAQFFYNSAQLLGMIGLIIVPPGLIWTVRQFIKQEGKHRLASILLWIIPLTVFLSTTYLSNKTRDFSRSFAIERAEKLIEEIEFFKQQKGFYPNSLTNTGIKIPSTGIIGIEDFYYKKNADNYELFFHQNVFLSFNFEIVTYNKNNSHSSKGEMKKLYETGYDYWKYEIFD